MTCVLSVDHSRIKVEENGRQATVLNPNREDYKKIEIDDCLIRQGIRCDWAIHRQGVGTVFIELKGSNVSHAIEQLFATVPREEVRPYTLGEIGFLVVCSQIPKFGSHIAKAKVRAAREYKAGFRVVKNRAEFRLPDVLRITE